MYFRKLPRQSLMILLTAALVLTACNVGAEPSPTLDVNAINTAIVGTTVAQFSAQFTQTALAAPPTNTPPPTTDPQSLPTFALPTTDSGGALPTVSFNTTQTVGSTPIAGFTQIAASPAAPGGGPALGDSCLNSVFEEDVTIPDGQVVKGGETLQKIWKIRNTGSCTWDEGFRLVNIGGDPAVGVTNFEFQSKDAVVSGAAVNVGVWFTAPCAAGKYESHWRMQDDAGYYFGTYLSLYIEVQGKIGGCV